MVVPCARLWNLSTGQPIAVTGGDDRTVRLWNLSTGQPIGQPLTSHIDWVRSVACAELDGQPIAVTGGDDGTVRRWNLSTGQPIGQPFTGHDAAVNAVACTELDGRPIAVTCGTDGTVRLWNLLNQKVASLLLLPTSCRAVAVSSTGTLVCGFGSDIAFLRRDNNHSDSAAP
jgi:WD40 repeat protein